MCCIPQEDESVNLAAMHYYIQFGSAYNKDDIQKVVDECVTTTLIKSESVTKWVDLIGSAHSQVQKERLCVLEYESPPEGNRCIFILQAPYVTTNQEREAVKGELVNAARLKWPLDFSKFYEVTMISGQSMYCIYYKQYFITGFILTPRMIYVVIHTSL